MNFLLGINVGILGLLAVLVLNKRDGSTVDRWLAAYLLCAVGMYLSAYVMIAYPSTPAPIRLFGGGHGFMLLTVLFYAYVRAVCGYANRLLLVWLIPFLTSMAWGLWLTQTGRESVVDGFTVIAVQAEWERWINVILMVIHLAFPIAGLVVLRRFGQRAREVSSDLQSVTLNWIRWLLATSMGILMVAIALFLPGRELNLIPLPIAGAILMALLSGQQFLMGLFGLRQTRVFVVDETASDALRASAVDKAKASADLSQLRDHLDASGLFQRSRLTLDELSESIGWAPSRISAAIREAEDNFFEFINRYRVDEFKSRVANPRYRRASMLRLAYDCGFNSKSAFNAVFRRLTGLTPTQFRNQVGST